MSVTKAEQKGTKAELLTTGLCATRIDEVGREAIRAEELDPDDLVAFWDRVPAAIMRVTHSNRIPARLTVTSKECG